MIPFLALAAGHLTSAAPAARADEMSLDEARRLVREDDRRRVEVMGDVAPSVVCIFDEGGGGGGSGVIVTEEGYGLTNFHVIAAMLGTRVGEGGLSDGELYPLEVLGIDPTGDVAMFRLKGKERFSPARLGDSDAVAVGNRVFAMGNPFMMAEDYTPTVTYGIVSGVHRYQFGADNRALVYTDCIQVDASINPGNSGGPLFNMQGEVIGINGRASFEHRGRVNVGVGYAISINQIKRFIPGLRAGLLVEHGSLGATTIDTGYQQVVFEKMLEPSAASAAGIHVGDRLISFGGRRITSSNQFANVLGTFPADWPVDVVFEHEGERFERRVRLERLPVPMDERFEVDQELNRSEAQRVLEACLARLGRVPVDRTVRWRAKRSVRMADVQGKPRQAEFVIEAVERPDGRGERRLLTSKGEMVKRFEYSPVSAEAIDPKDTRQEPDRIDRQRLVLWSAAMKALYAAASVEIERWEHRGSDRYGESVCHVLEYEQEEGTDLLVTIEPETDLPRRFRFRAAGVPTIDDHPVEIELDEFEEIDGVWWPMRIVTRSGHHLVIEDSVSECQLESGS